MFQRRFVSGLLSTVLLTGASLAGVARTDLEKSCDELAARHALSGVVLVARGDDVLLERAYGVADAEAEEPIGPRTRFLVASLTKPVVAFLTLRLVDAEVLALEDRVASRFPELERTALADVSVHQLLTHTSGLAHYEVWPGFLDDVRRARTESELLELLAQTSLQSSPGSEFRYSGPGYLLLGLLLERAASDSLEQLLEQWVFEPLGMDRSGLLATDAYDGTFARPYARANDGLAPAPLRHFSTLGATGGLITTARDLHRFARAIQSGQLLPEELHATLLRVARGQYACGLIVYRHPWTRERFARHKGSMDGVAAHFVFGLDDERVTIALSNVGGTPVDDIDDLLIMKVRPRAEVESDDR